MASRAGPLACASAVCAISLRLAPATPAAMAAAKPAQGSRPTPFGVVGPAVRQLAHAVRVELRDLGAGLAFDARAEVVADHLSEEAALSAGDRVEEAARKAERDAHRAAWLVLQLLPVEPRQLLRGLR